MRNSTTPMATLPDSMRSSLRLRSRGARRVGGASAYWICAGVAVLALTACGADQPAGRWAGTIDTLAAPAGSGRPHGAIVVQNPAAPSWEPSDAWRIVEELRIGTATGTGPELFGNVVDLEVDALGRIYVLDRQANEVRVFDAEGRHVRSFGRQGGGPGEFDRPVGLDWGPDGHLWVADPRNTRFSVFDTTGTFVTSRRRPSGLTMSPWPGGFGSAGRLYDVSMVPSDEPGFHVGLVRYTSGVDGTFVPADTFPLPQDEGELFELRRGNMILVTPVPFSARMVFRFDPRGYIWLGMTAPYRIYQRGLAGDTIRIIERDYAPIPVTGEEVERALEHDLEDFRSQGGRVDPDRIPDEKPAFRTFFLDDTGHLWVEPVTDEVGEGSIFDIFDPEGRYLGRIRSPFWIERPLFRDGMLYARTTDELEVPYVVRARVERGSAAGN